MKQISAYCPASLSLLFNVCLEPTILQSGSTGLGFTVDKGVKAIVEESDRQTVFFNGKEIKFPTVDSSINKITSQTFNVFLESPLPLGFGFGISAASAISTILVINKLLCLNLTQNEIFRITHIAEIENRTGLGTVGTVSTGGFSLKTRAGFPPHVKKFPYSGINVYTIVIGKLLTPSILKNRSAVKKINSAADSVLKLIKPEATFETMLDLALEYDIKSGLLSDPTMRKIITDIKKAGGHASMAKLGKVIISSIRPFKMYNYPVYELRISHDTPKLI